MGLVLPFEREHKFLHFRPQLLSTKHIMRILEDAACQRNVQGFGINFNLANPLFHYALIQNFCF